MNTDTPRTNEAQFDTGRVSVDFARTLERELAALRPMAEQHRKLCLAELGGEDVWPCGCHIAIVDSYGVTKPLTAADGKEHAECEHHAALRAQVASLNDSWVTEGLRASGWRKEHDKWRACAEQLAKALMAIEWRGSKPTPGGYQQYCCPACKGDLISKQHGESCDIARALAAFAKLKGGAR